MMIQSVLDELTDKFLSQSAHTFLLHLNVDDTFLRGDAFKDLDEILKEESVASKAYFVVSFNLVTGITFPDEKSEAEFLNFFKVFKKTPEAVVEFRMRRHELGYAMRFFTEMLKIKLSGVKEILGEQNEKKFKKSQFFMAVILERLETLIPPNSASGECHDRLGYVAVLDMAQDKAIKRAGNILILVAESLMAVSPQLKIETKGVNPVKVSFPNSEERLRTFNYLGTIHGETLKSIQPESFSSNSAGMSCNNIIKLVGVAAYGNKSLTADEVFEEKKRFIEDTSGGLMEIQRPLWGLNAIGSLQEYKDYILEVVRNMKNKALAAVPNGILLLGAPGTGKTVFVQAMAYEAGIPMVVMKNTREMWVGSSERNLEFSLELIKTMAPVIVFIDEIDQEFVRRGTYSGDSGVSQRMQSRLFRFMSDTDLRGKILWIAASNLPHILDPALLREGRFDDKIPFFPQDARGREDIVRALLRKNKILAEALKTGFAVSDDIDEEFIRKFARMAHAHSELIGNDSRTVRRCNFDSDHELDEKEKDSELYYTGAQLETIITRAFRMAEAESAKLSQWHLLYVLQEDYIPPIDMLTHEELTKSALMFTNSQRFIPKQGKWAKLAKSTGIVINTSKEKSLRTEVEFDDPT